MPALATGRLELTSADPAGWGRWRVVLRDEPRTVVGGAGFEGPPADGTVEINYDFAPEFGEFATETVAVLAAWAGRDLRVAVVIAHAESADSARILERAAFERVESGALRYERRYRANADIALAVASGV